ncbi:MAG: MaoC family dehydratase [Candidatus Thorarchaeota archaeon]
MIHQSRGLRHGSTCPAEGAIVIRWGSFKKKQVLPMKITRHKDFNLGQSAEVVRTIREEDIQTFGDLSGDYNPLHFDEEWSSTTFFEGRIAHGLLAASFISAVIGMHLPGTGTIYLSQKISFKGPVRIGDSITARAAVVHLNDEKQHITLTNDVHIPGWDCRT